jgi:DNA polymerase III epsilon subunit-like protein
MRRHDGAVVRLRRAAGAARDPQHMKLEPENAGVRDARLPDPEACAALVAALGRFAVVDLETTGLDAGTSRVIEVGAVLLAPGEEPVLIERLVDPGVPVPPLTQTLTGIRDEDLRGAASWAEVARALSDLTRGAIVVAHNAAFEQAFLAGVVDPGTQFLDTLELACVLRPELTGHSLESLARELLGRTERHRALDDVLDTLAVLAVLGRGIAAGEHGELNALLGRVDWAWGRLLGWARARRRRKGKARESRGIGRAEAERLTSE